MPSRVVSRLREFFEAETTDELRSIVRYDGGDADVEYLRDGVATEYSEEELAAAIDESRMESLYTPIYERAFADDHGDLQCMVMCFENVVEMNFVVGDGVGVAVALDAEAMDEAHGFVSRARNVVLEERE